MKIKISKTELYGTPHIAWNEFCYFVMDNQEDESVYTPVQKTAAMCFWYYSEVCGEGHEGYFDNYENVDKDQLTEALQTIGAPKFADNLTNAVKYGLEDDYVKTDTWFGENEETLFKAIEKYVRGNVSEFYEIVDEDYTMQHSKYFYRLGVIGAVSFFALAVIFLIVGGGALIAAAGFVIFGLVSVFFSIYMKTWKITVKKDTFTVYKPFRKPKKYRLNEISEVRQRQQKFVVYIDYRKAFAVDNIVSDYEIFYAQLHAAGKMEQAQHGNGFVVRLYKGNTAVIMMSFLFFVGIFFWVILWPDEMVDVVKHIITAVFSLGAFLTTLQYLFWRVTVTDDTITVKYTFGSEREYYIREITKGIRGKEKLILYDGNKKIAKIPYSCDDYQILVERLQREGVPFYEGKRG